MKINSFKAEGVHGYLNFDISFFPDLTFLIGINGSGKTSALKLILGLTSPSFNYLNRIEYKYCELICSNNDQERNIKIIAKQNKAEQYFTLTLFLDNLEYKSENIKRFIRNNEDSYDWEELSALEQRHKEMFDALSVTAKIRELATPKFLGLDRRIYEGRIIDQRQRMTRSALTPKYRRRILEGYSELTNIDASLDEVQILVFDYIRKIAQQQSQISDDFKQKIFSQSFSFIEEYSVGAIPETAAIENRKKEVLEGLNNLGMKYLDWSVNVFFNKISEITKKNEEIPNEEKESKGKKSLSSRYIDILIKWNYNGAQLKRIDEIIVYSQEYQRKIAELRAPLKRMEDIITNFLKESRKTLHIAADGEIQINQNHKVTNVYELSSGEKQIIIMIAHLIFEEDQKPSGIFIIDEPELSLHIAWQEIFVSSIIEASPKTQFVLATHSPSIIAKVDKEKYCQDLNKLNF